LRKINWYLWAVMLAALVYYVWMAAKIYYFQTADGRIYLEVAGNLASGKGLTYLSDGQMRPYVFWPPLFPVLIGLIAKVTGMSILASFYFLSGICIIFTFYFLYKIFRFYRLKPLLMPAGFVLYWFSWLFFLHFGALSETLFIPLFLGSFYYFMRWIQLRTNKDLWLTGIFLALALMTRYATFGIIAAYVFIIYLESEKFADFIRHSVKILVPPVAVFIPWYLYTLRFSSFFQRDWGYHPVGDQHIYQLNVTVANWITPGLTKILIIPVLILLILSMVAQIKKLPDLITDKYLYVPVLTGGIYFLFIILSISFFDYDTPLDARILAPVYFSLLPAGLYYLQQLKSSSPGLFYMLLGLILISHVWNIYPKSKELRMQAGQIEHLRDSRFIRTVERYQNRIMWSNVTDLLKLYVHNDTLVREFPVKYDRKSLHTNLAFRSEMDSLKKRLDREKGMIVYFFGFMEREFLPDLEDFNQYFDNYPVYRFNEGLIIFHSGFQDTLKVEQAHE